MIAHKQVQATVAADIRIGFHVLCDTLAVQGSYANLNQWSGHLALICKLIRKNLTNLYEFSPNLYKLQSIQKQLSQCDKHEIAALVGQRQESAVSCQKCYNEQFKSPAELYSSFLADRHAQSVPDLSFPGDAQSVPDFEDSIAQTCNEWLEQCCSLRENLDSLSKIKERDGVEAVHSKLAQHVKVVASEISTLNASGNKCFMLYRQELALGRAAECAALVYFQQMPAIKLKYERLSASFRKLLHRMPVLLQSRHKIAQVDSTRLQ